MYKCPCCNRSINYKNKSYSSWKEVNRHMANCKDNNKDYIICNNYGPLAIENLNTFSSVKEIWTQYPNLSFDRRYFKYLRQINPKFTLRPDNKWSTESIVESIKNFHREHDRIPQCNDFLHNSKYPSFKTVSNYFGSWNKAIEVAGFSPSLQRGLGVNTYAKDNILYDSQAEAYFVDNYLHGKYTYDYYTPYGNGWFYDFYIKELDLYIEIDGGFTDTTGGYRTKIENKILYNQQLNRKFKVITLNDLYSVKFKLS
jgi:hypothetical protein